MTITSFSLVLSIALRTGIAICLVLVNTAATKRRKSREQRCTKS